MEIAEESSATATGRLIVSVCVGTNCYLKGSYDVLQEFIQLSRKYDIEKKVEFKGTFCIENCAHGPSVKIGLENQKFGVAVDEIEQFFMSEILSRVKSTVKV